jgi:hypothetical protein
MQFAACVTPELGANVDEPGKAVEVGDTADGYRTVGARTPDDDHR